MPRIAVVGSYGVGLTFGVDRAPERGETVIGDLFRTDPGGKGSNQAIGAARLGADAVILTAVGEDQFGDGAFELWADEGVDATAVVRASRPTMVAAILVDAAGENRIAIVPGALSELEPAHVDGFAERIAAADVLLVQLEIPVDGPSRARDRSRSRRPDGAQPAPAPPASCPRTCWPSPTSARRTRPRRER